MILWTLNFLEIFSKNTLSYFMTIPLVGGKLFHWDGRTDKYDEPNTRFPQFCVSAQKEKQILE